MPLDELLNIRQKIAFEVMKTFLISDDDTARSSYRFIEIVMEVTDNFMKAANIEFNFPVTEKN